MVLAINLKGQFFIGPIFSRCVWHHIQHERLDIILAGKMLAMATIRSICRIIHCVLTKEYGPTTYFWGAGRFDTCNTDPVVFVVIREILPRDAFCCKDTLLAFADPKKEGLMSAFFSSNSVWELSAWLMGGLEGVFSSEARLLLSNGYSFRMSPSFCSCVSSYKLKRLFSRLHREG